MRKSLCLLMLLCTATVNAAHGPVVLIIGDSLSAGYGIDVDQSWVALLQNRLQSQGYEHQVVNASISGDTSEGGASRIKSALGNFKPSLVILELGGNDGLRGLPTARMKNNLKSIISASQASGATVIMLGIRIPGNYGPRYNREFESVYRELATELDIQWIEFFMKDIAQHSALMQEDGIHPNAAAQSILLDNAWPTISGALSGRADNRLQQH